MNVSRLEKAYMVLLAVIFGGIVLHAPISVGLGVLFPDYDLLIKSWKEVLMLASVPLAIAIITRRNLWQELWRDWIFRLIIAYVILHFLTMAVLYQGAAATAAGLAIDLRYILFFGLVYILVRTLPVYRRLLLKISLIGAVIVVGFATLQLFLPPDILKHLGYSKETIVPYLTVDENPDYVRVNSTLRGPNPLGAYAAVVLTLLIAALVRKRLQFADKKIAIGIGLLTLCSLIALWVSYSRSALLAVVASVAVVLAMTIARRLSRKVWVITAAVTFAIIGGLIANQNSSFVSNVLLHENPNEGNSFNSNDGHLESLIHGTELLIAQPLGAGVGSTGSASLYTDTPRIIENQYLFVAHETGWLGLLVFVAIFIAVLLRLWRERHDWISLGVFASGIGLALIGALQPVWVDDTVSIIWWGLAGLAIASSKKEDRKG